MPKNTAQIGKADERMIVKDLEALGYRARRQPGSGNRAVDLQGDVVWLDSPVGRIGIEAKYRQDCAWKTLETWRAGQDMLTLRCDARRGDQNGKRMVYMEWDLFLQFAGEAGTVEYEGDDPVLVRKDLSQVRRTDAVKREIQSQGFQKGHRPMRRA